MNLNEARTLKRGDRVRNTQLDLSGTVEKTVVEGGGRPDFQCRIFWKGWNPYDLDQVDWTWNWVMERETPNIAPQQQIEQKDGNSR